MPGAKRRALKKLLSPHSGPKESHQSFPTGTEHSNVDPIAVPTLSHSPVQSVDGLASTTTSLRDLSVSPLPPSAADQGSVELQLVDEMQNRENVIGSGHASLASSPSNTLSPPAATPSSGGGYTVDDLLNAGTDGKGKKKSSKQRFLEREARKKEERAAAAPQVDPAESSRLEREKAEEADIIGRTCRELGVELHEIDPDGHCMYSAIADQLYLLGLTKQPSYQITRHAASTYLLENPDSFMPFVPSIMGEDMAGAVEEGGSEKVYAEYCKRVEQSGDWGGEIEIQALSRYYNVPIHVIQRGPPFIISHAPGEAGNGTLSSEESLKQGNVVRISYHRRMYGLGEHYNSLRPARRHSDPVTNGHTLPVS
ncbi:hypothetical protein FFLO_00316 [Filobasidium floriforme]|uniref:OTU domain-containing protein n=1 Tax=Filobasidium floriforme TaxID=5210 RepID=A0A8K0JSD7_9TREE|nr:uncharacterized protein HD553DRAFT_313871 [Filobasidium floriforme]KAG7575497.1 hypothetical protein FFLO_00316 [Filobasidium floriforme]KAH8082637.1 hypothetical protein HD553DRAFT_313871 [Filobasidium floriforme]